MENKRFYITTAIPYVNAAPHIGHALEFVQADAIARYHREIGDDTYFLSGTDENALKNVQSAEKAGVPVAEFVKQNSERFYALKKALNLSFDDFIRTTETRHVNGVQKLWSACNADDIYKKSYKGLYCVGCEQFYTEKELVGNCCPEHGTVLEEVEEENYFFRWSKYGRSILDFYSKSPDFVVPASRFNEIRSFVEGGLKDFRAQNCLAEQIHANKEKYKGQTIGRLADAAGMKLVRFIHWELGKE
jgi:methionyl-tRNA synthetase